VTDDGGVDLMLQFQLKRGGDKTKCCRKMKQIQQAHLCTIGRKRDTVQRHRGGAAPMRGKGGDDAS
jgi:hypothetical protein